MGQWTRPEITEGKIEQIRNIIAENPDWNRTKISKHLCRLWGWQNPNGFLKDISCRDVLRKIDKAGEITLLPSERASGAQNKVTAVRHFEHDTTPINAKLEELLPLHIRKIDSGKESARFKSYIDQYHYLGFNRPAGENMKYMVYSQDGIPLSCLMFGAAAWSCRERDQLIGWDKTQRAGDSAG